MGDIGSIRADIDLVKVTQLIAMNLKLAELSPRELQGRSWILYFKSRDCWNKLLTGHELKRRGDSRR